MQYEEHVEAGVNRDLHAVAGLWSYWDHRDTHNWNTTKDGYRLFGKARSGSVPYCESGALRCMISQPRAYRSGHLVTKTVRRSSDNWKKYHIHMLCRTWFLPKRKNWPGMWRSGAAMAPVTVRWWSSESWGKATRQKAEWQPSNSGEQTGVLERISWYITLDRGGVQESWLIFKNQFQAQERSTLKSRKSSRSDGRPLWMNQEFLINFKYKKEGNKIWKQQQVTQKEYRRWG